MRLAAPLARGANPRFSTATKTDSCQRARQAGFGIRYVPSASAVYLDGNLDSSASLLLLILLLRPSYYYNYYYYLDPWQAQVVRCQALRRRYDGVPCST